MGDLWVFGYGSLMWRPGFDYVEARPATLVGYRRCFCIYSVHHRGTHARPGLVLGLDRGGVCRGMVFRVGAANAQKTLAYLRAREQVNGVYREARVPLMIEGDAEPVIVLAYLAERSHPSFAGSLPLEQQAHIIRAARGLSGANLEYLASTLAHLRLLGIRERELERMHTLAGAMVSRGPEADRKRRIAGLARVLAMGSVRAPVLHPSHRKRFTHRVGIGVQIPPG